MNRIIESIEVDPYYNLALEEELLSTVHNEVILYLWQNDKTVVIGNNQNPYLECNLKKMEEKNIKLARRLSGGGAVYHDLENLNFTFLMEKEKINLEKEMQTIILALQKLGIEAKLNSRNDISVEGYKVSGHAYYYTITAYYHHGTIMIDVDMNTLSSILTPSPYKVQSKGVSSISSRVKNLKEWNENITVYLMKEKLIESFQELYGMSKVEIVSKENLTLEKTKFYQSHQWLFGESPDYDILLEKKYPNYLLQLALTITNNHINNVKVYSDSLYPLPIKDIEEILKNKEFQEKQIFDQIDCFMG